jgi:hypothetical protein
MSGTHPPYYWHRLPDEELSVLTDLFLRNDYGGMVGLLNRHRIAPRPLSVCCDLIEVREVVWAYLLKKYPGFTP